ncbi:DUF6988 family protein [Burkholderia cepacia]|uniref:DUF6988 family protein n=1 Tax=Burkholderia cepacia TaxID=292 RepID=UPI0007543E6C|nr:hypothetical protein [Burkholderia cepacia]KVW75490.1 hypothetical protein WL00_02345 [Burkholderia cepacia]KVX62306.1 hypothetical protein WL07_34690 [Burkholderia cepacia]
MQTSSEYTALVNLVRWIDDHTAGLTLPADERSQLVIGCLDVTLEHQAAIALLHSAQLHGSMLALMRVLSESLVRGLWLHFCATDSELIKFRNGRLDKTFGTLIKEYEAVAGTPDGVLSVFKLSAWTQLNDFTHTGFLQVSRRHKPGRVEGNYPDHDLRVALRVAGVLGLVAGGHLTSLAGRNDLLPLFMTRMSEYAQPTEANQSTVDPKP